MTDQIMIAILVTYVRTWILKHGLELGLVHILVIPNLVPVRIHSDVTSQEQDIINCRFVRQADNQFDMST